MHMTQQPTTKPIDNRKELARLLVFYRKERGTTLRTVADKLGCSQTRIEAYEAATDIPTGRDWEMYCSLVDRRIRQHTMLRLAALGDRDRENDRKRGMQSETLTHNPLAVVAKLDIRKPTTVELPPAPAPAKPPELNAKGAPRVTEPDRAARSARALALLPRGWKMPEAREQRQAYALDLFRQRPNASLTGNDSAEEALKRTFGVGLSPATLNDLREQARKEISGRPGIVIEVAAQEIAAANAYADSRADVTTYRGSPAPGPLVGLAPPETQPASPDDNIRSAVELVLESIPNLASFTIHVDEHGEASIDYRVREVRIIENTGSMKVKVAK